MNAARKNRSITPEDFNYDYISCHSFLDFVANIQAEAFASRCQYAHDKKQNKTKQNKTQSERCERWMTGFKWLYAAWHFSV